MSAREAGEDDLIVAYGRVPLTMKVMDGGYSAHRQRCYYQKEFTLLLAMSVG